MGTNAMSLMIVPIAVGVVLGTALGVVALLLVKSIGALARRGPAEDRVHRPAAGPATRWRPIVAGFGNAAGRGHG